MTCAACGTENAVGRKFCGGCGASLALTCPACGSPNEPGMRFCGECGAALTADAAAPAAPAERIAERRLVSVLFADLVGFTPFSESRDPEEVRELLSRYFDTCRRLIGIYGGTVEKFIGDAVMAVWGTPTAQEDDAERAVRAALDLVAAVTQLGDEIGAPELRARAGVLTGEAAVTIGATSEGMVVGDLVNTAARIQSAAQPGTVLVGESTKRASDAAIAYEPAGTFELKGKSEPTALYRAVRVTAVRGGALRSGELEPPFVGRDRELHLVKELYHVASEERRAQLVSVSGIGGIGKSRLAWEFEKYLDGLTELAWWHRGRCLAYGDGVAYWALAEMVRMRALIAEEDNPATATAKLSAVLSERVPEAAERNWLEPRLQQLLCLVEGGDEDRQSLFSAWRLFFERLADDGAVVLVFEDLQWADEGLLDFIEHLLDWSRSHPIYVLALARPELVERRPGFGASGRNATTLALEPLPSSAMESLLDGFAPGLPPDLHARILERAEGVPLYAVETVRMLLDRGLLERDGEVYRPTGEIDALEVPETLHALVAARLDGLAPDERRALQDAAVLGKSFTKAGLAALSGVGGDALEPVLRSLVRKEVLSVQADPRSPERGQYCFLQDLLKRIAYETLSRSDRKTRHLAAAAHLERVGSTEQEFVEVIAAHYLDAYQAMPDAADAPALRAKAAERLAQAGERACSVCANEAGQRYYEKAAGLCDDELQRAMLLEEAGEAALLGYRYEAALELFDEAIAIFNAQGATHAAARASASLGWVMWRNGDLAGGAERLDQALAVLADDEPDAEIAALIEALGRLRYFQGDIAEALARVDRALEIAEALVAVPVLVDALNTKSLILGGQGRHQEQQALLERAIALARANDASIPLLRGLNNLSVQFMLSADFVAARRIADEGVELARRVGHRDAEQQCIGSLCYLAWLLGDWETSRELRDLITAPGAYPAFYRAAANANHALAQADFAAARAALATLEGNRESTDGQIRSGYFGIETEILLAEERYREATVTARTAQTVSREVNPQLNAFYWGRELAAWAGLGDADRVDELLREGAQLPRARRNRYVDAVEAEFTARLNALRGEHDTAFAAYSAAAGHYRFVELPYELAIVLIGHGQLLVEVGLREESAPLFAEARAILEGLGERLWLERLERIESATPARV